MYPCIVYGSDRIVIVCGSLKKMLDNWSVYSLHLSKTHIENNCMREIIVKEWFDLFIPGATKYQRVQRHLHSGQNILESNIPPSKET
ncbi:f61aec5b-bd3a-4fde-a4a0-a97ee8885cb3 [Sclerotinia trifoliorum]|uniref:F61aec5b-bd3a-4fde-a4a0-a97ee8885cb3 n=1 Tax=Sclerotinia trifoliorum TaxID=28548 RepID=A0A8H2VVJ8_9HELO|nr:f61aec5b-bd3a-4fde-a4a0-a97ee8885cb3 [Sclerotinia trifoliorum]